jgi:hypothetical protein
LMGDRLTQPAINPTSKMTGIRGMNMGLIIRDVS